MNFQALKRFQIELTKQKKKKKMKLDTVSYLSVYQILIILKKAHSWQKTPPPQKKKIYIYIYKYINVETQKIDTIEFLDYKKWYETKGAIWNSTQNKNTYRNMFENYNDREATRKIIKKRNDLLLYKKMLEEINTIYTMVGNKNYWIHKNVNR